MYRSQAQFKSSFLLLGLNATSSFPFGPGANAEAGSSTGTFYQPYDPLIPVLNNWPVGAFTDISGQTRQGPVLYMNALSSYEARVIFPKDTPAGTWIIQIQCECGTSISPGTSNVPPPPLEITPDLSGAVFNPIYGSITSPDNYESIQYHTACDTVWPEQIAGQTGRM